MNYNTTTINHCHNNDTHHCVPGGAGIWTEYPATRVVADTVSLSSAEESSFSPFVVCSLPVSKYSALQNFWGYEGKRPPPPTRWVFAFPCHVSILQLLLLLLTFQPTTHLNSFSTRGDEDTFVDLSPQFIRHHPLILSNNKFSWCCVSSFHCFPLHWLLSRMEGTWIGVLSNLQDNRYQFHRHHHQRNKYPLTLCNKSYELSFSIFLSWFPSWVIYTPTQGSVLGISSSSRNFQYQDTV